MASKPCLPVAAQRAARTRLVMVRGLRRRAYGRALQPFQCPVPTCLGPQLLRRLSRQAAARPSPSADEPSGIWQAPGIYDWLDPGSMACAGELEFFPSEQDSPTLDYVMRYPAPTEDDPDHPTYIAAAAAAGLLGPNLHAPLEPEPADSADDDNDDDGYDADGGGGATAATRRRGQGWRYGATSLIAQLRQRALAGSSSDDEGQAGGEREWQSLDIPALLLTPHHAAALQSLSSSEEDTWRVPDFADQGRAREADRAAQAAAEQAPPELRPLVRAASLLVFHHDQGPRLGPGGGLGGSDSSQAAAAGGPEAALHLQEANRFSGLCEPLTDEQLEAVAMVISAAATRDCCDEGVADPPLPGGSSSEPAHTAATAAADKRMTAAAAAAAAALAEEGLEWLGVAAASPATAAAAAVGPSTGAKEPPPERVEGGVKAAMDAEERSVQLRRRPRKAAAESGMDEATRGQVAEEAAQELAEAEAHVVAHHTGGGVTHGSVGHFLGIKLVSPQAGGGGGAEEKVEEVAVAGGRTAADEAAEAVAAEARLAVWGEAGWPYGASMRSTDLVEELKHSIQQQQEEAEQGAQGTLLP